MCINKLDRFSKWSRSRTSPSIKNLLFFNALLLVSLVLFVPFAPIMPWESLDPSWAYGMNEAVAEGLSFGKEIVFTMGPYASVYTKTYHPVTDQLMMWGSSYLAISFAVAAYLNFRLERWPLKIALLTVLISVMYYRDVLFFFYTLMVGVQVYQWTILRDSKRDVGLSEIALGAALFIPFGLLPLVKSSILFACMAVTILSVVLLARVGLWKQCLLVGVTPLVSLVVFWALAGQPLIGVADYFAVLPPIVGGYAEAMAINGNPNEYILYILAAAALVVLLLREAKGFIYEKLIVSLIFFSILFLAFKAGFVRHDSHAVLSGTMILLGGVLAGVLLPARSSLVLLLICLISWVYIDVAYIKTSPRSVKENIKGSYTSAWAGLKQRIKDPVALLRNFESRVHELSIRGGIPKLNGSVDIYSYDQAYLIASGNKWSPRPIFQSYAVYASRLAEINRSHLLGNGSPDNIVFRVQPIDGRLPALEDGASWPVLLAKYQLAGKPSESLYLVRRKVDSSSGELIRALGGGQYFFGEQIVLPNPGGVVFAKINFNKSIFGAIANAIFKPSQLEIKLTMKDGVVKNFRLIAGMAEAGFVVSPLIENTREFALLFGNKRLLNDNKVKSIQINASSLPFLWRQPFEAHFFSVPDISSVSSLETLR